MSDLKIVDLGGMGEIAGHVQKAAAPVIERGADLGHTVLSRVCNPVAEEIGLYLQDVVKGWRKDNASKVLHKFVARIQNIEGVRIPPRLMWEAVEKGSWAGDDFVQDMWAGLLASSASPDGHDDANLLFMELLNGLTRGQARVINYAAEQAKKSLTPSGWVLGNPFLVPLDEVCKLIGTDDPHRADLELDALVAKGLFSTPGGFSPDETLAAFYPSPLGLQFYVRCQGFVGSPRDYFGLTEKDLEDTRLSAADKVSVLFQKHKLVSQGAAGKETPNANPPARA